MKRHASPLSKVLDKTQDIRNVNATPIKTRLTTVPAAIKDVNAARYKYFDGMLEFFGLLHPQGIGEDVALDHIRKSGEQCMDPFSRARSHRNGWNTRSRLRERASTSSPLRFASAAKYRSHSR